MQIEVLKSKLHCVTVTEANLNYMGSITIDEDLMDAAGLIAGEKVQIDVKVVPYYCIKGKLRRDEKSLYQYSRKSYQFFRRSICYLKIISQ